MKIKVIVHPNSRREGIEKDLLETIHVYVSQPPLEGKANRAVISALSEFFKVRKSGVKLISGIKSKHKLFEIIL